MAPPRVTASINHSACDTSVPNPKTPTTISNASESAQIRQRMKTCWRKSPCRNKKAFCAPIATIRLTPRRKPALAAKNRLVNWPPDQPSASHHIAKQICMVMACALTFMTVNPMTCKQQHALAPLKKRELARTLICFLLIGFRLHFDAALKISVIVAHSVYTVRHGNNIVKVIAFIAIKK